MTDWAHLKSEFVWAYRGTVGAPYRHTRAHHPGQSALFMEKGRLRVETEGGVVNAEPGQWVFPKEGTRLQLFSDDAEILSVHFRLYWPGGQPLFDWPVALLIDAAEASKLGRQTRTLIRLVNKEMPGAAKSLPWRYGNAATHFRFQLGFDSWLCAYVETLIAAGMQPSRLGHLDPRVLQAVNILDEIPLMQTMNEVDLATQVGLSASQLSRLFTRQFNLTPRQYLEERKISRAKDLIRSSPLSIKQITYELGFSSLPSFSRWFRQKTGTSPSEFQRENAEEYAP